MDIGHLRKCCARLITTADYLVEDVHDDVIPADPETREDFGFEQCRHHVEEANLLGVYQGLVKNLCFLFYAYTLEGYHPPPNGNGPAAELWYEFGFATCKDERAEGGLGAMYQRRIGGDKHWRDRTHIFGETYLASHETLVCHFDEFWRAWMSGEIHDLFDKYGLTHSSTGPTSDLRHFPRFPHGSNRPSIWRLKHMLLLDDNTPPSWFNGMKAAAKEYGFTPRLETRVKIELREFYRALLKEYDPLDIQEARNLGNLDSYSAVILKNFSTDVHRIVERLAPRRGNRARISSTHARKVGQVLGAGAPRTWDKKLAVKLPVLNRVQEDEAAEAGKIVTAQTIWEIYSEAWTLYATAMHLDGADNGSTMSSELPCWMRARKNFVPPDDGWSEFKDLWTPISESAGQLDSRLKRIIGTFILVTFNSNTKEAGTNHNPGSWQHGKPTFFHVQLRAQYFSPPQDSHFLQLDAAYTSPQLPGSLETDAAPRVLTAEKFQQLERAVHRDCVRVMGPGIEEASEEEMTRQCRRVLRHMILLAGTNWLAIRK
ncbi:hypothetical protein PCL_10538 [Purpureocillium lilacinum]|uniref:Uncharacterized protein n=1 Tax=Purpureocillium lilacinum TaxID=33203 RepID=A0A2U3DQ48_PURLI|nr:hypothetical protein PCL_10538 [Purpureocillium lilacinum]